MEKDAEEEVLTELCGVRLPQHVQAELPRLDLIQDLDREVRELTQRVLEAPQSPLDDLTQLE